MQAIAWNTSGSDQTADVTFSAEIDVPITVWIVAQPFAANQQTALTLWQAAQQLYLDERMGLRLGTLEVVDATANPKAAAWGAFACGAANANVAALQADIGARTGRINVYMVSLVDGSTSRGNACAIGASFAAIAAGANADLLAH